MGYTHPMNASLLERITIEPGKCGGRPCIRGKRIRVTDVLAAIAYAARQTSHAVIRVA